MSKSKVIKLYCIKKCFINLKLYQVGEELNFEYETEEQLENFLSPDKLKDKEERKKNPSRGMLKHFSKEKPKAKKTPVVSANTLSAVEAGKKSNVTGVKPK